MNENEKPGPDVCNRKYTRDDLRYFLFMREANAVDDADAEEIAQHLERDDCSWCLKESEFLYWTEPALTTAGRERYEELMRGLELEVDDPTPGIPPDRAESSVGVTVRDAADGLVVGSHRARAKSSVDVTVRDRLQSIRDAFNEPDEERRCMKIVDAITECFSAGLSEDDWCKAEKEAKEEFFARFSQLPQQLKMRAWSVLERHNSLGLKPVPLLQIVKDDKLLMFAVTLQVAAIMPAVQPFPITADSQLMLDPTAYVEGIDARFPKVLTVGGLF